MGNDKPSVFGTGKLNFLVFKTAILILGIALFCSTNAAAQNFSLVGYAAGTTGGKNGRTVTARTLSELTGFLQSSETLIVQVPATISGAPSGAEIRVASNKTLVGTTRGILLNGIGLRINSGSTNIIIRNLRLTMSNVTRTETNDEGRQQVVANDGDTIRITGGQRIWIDHCEFYAKDPATQTNQDLYDGLVDASGSSRDITVSWSFFHDHHKASLIGSSDSDRADRRMTYHHNYFLNIKERLPSYRGGNAHVFNNFYSRVTGSGVNSRQAACVRVENNVFTNTDDPVGTFNSSSNPGKWQVIGNDYGNSTGSRPTSSTCSLSVPYSYSAVLTPTSSTASTVTANAGATLFNGLSGLP